ncbi:phosphatase PAP2 family protein [Actinoplanes sp. NPDC051633]|uniref:phosphatase PAP2 family protein n=1 Tax=Actinoplanes sp. NPDC051633 TaxID=3155670 RepID=UPI00342B92DC
MPAERPLALRLGVSAVLSVVLLVPFALLAAFVSGNWAPLRSLDGGIANDAHTWALGHPALVDAMLVWSWIFSPTGLRIAALGLVIWLFRRNARRVAWWVIVTMTTGGVVAALLKLLIERDRPSLLDPVARATGYSFPSGHAANAALTCAVFLLVLIPFRRARPALWVGAVVITLITGLCRIALGVHWTSDVVAGWLLGIAVVAVTTAAFEGARGRRRRTPVPVEGIEPEVAARR